MRFCAACGRDLIHQWFCLSLRGEGGKAAQDINSELPVFLFTAEHEDISFSKDSNLFNWVFLRRPTTKCRMYSVIYIYRLVSQNSC